MWKDGYNCFLLLLHCSDFRNNASISSPSWTVSIKGTSTPSFKMLLVWTFWTCVVQRKVPRQIAITTIIFAFCHGKLLQLLRAIMYNTLLSHKCTSTWIKWLCSSQEKTLFQFKINYLMMLQRLCSCSHGLYYVNHNRQLLIK